MLTMSRNVNMDYLIYSVYFSVVSFNIDKIMINIRLVIRLTISNCEKCYVAILSLAYLQLRQMWFILGGKRLLRV